MTDTFKTAKECIAELERRIGHGPYERPKGRSGQRQTRCEVCRRWKFADERCNLFSTTRTSSQGSDAQ